MTGSGGKIAQDLGFVEGPEMSRFHGRRHVLEPALSFRGPDLERQVPRPQARVAPFLFVKARPAPELGQEKAQVALRAFEVFWVKGSQYFVFGHPFIETLGQSLEKRHSPEAFVHGRWWHWLLGPSACLLAL
jgi:hypothetical protein